MSTERIRELLAPLTDDQRAVFRRLAPDFHMSFQITQGSEGPQQAVYQLMGHHYQQNWPSSHKAVLREMPGAFSVAAMVLPLPDEHKPQNVNDIRRVFMRQWEKMRIILGTEQQLALYSDLVGQLVSAVVARDLRYLTHSASLSGPGRPERQRGDPYASYFRSYIVQDSGISLPAYRAMFDEARAQYNGQQTPDGDVRQLATTWENLHRAHPNEAFRTDECFFAGSLVLPQLVTEHRIRHAQQP